MRVVFSTSQVFCVDTVTAVSQRGWEKYLVRWKNVTAGSGFRILGIHWIWSLDFDSRLQVTLSADRDHAACITFLRDSKALVRIRHRSCLRPFWQPRIQSNFEIFSSLDDLHGSSWNDGCPESESLGYHILLNFEPMLDLQAAVIPIPEHAFCLINQEANVPAIQRLDNHHCAVLQRKMLDIIYIPTQLQRVAASAGLTFWHYLICESGIILGQKADGSRFPGVLAWFDGGWLHVRLISSIRHSPLASLSGGTVSFLAPGGWFQWALISFLALRSFWLLLDAVSPGHHRSNGEAWCST
ncbi:hypothetical protein DFH29DRAFT_1071268 [Suillus ampliporus]|nr:hypothetical protein DFH29DRAFT_1071268 [Suillus ampliporus]